jgi:hypothetical protein
MKEWNVLVDYIDFYIYDHNTETIVINDLPESEKAREIYESFMDKYDIKNKYSLKWSFDIALDCIRNLKEEDRAYLRENCEVDFFGYGLYIRNKYIHCSKLHRYFCTDSQCSQVLSFIYTIMHYEYNRFEEKQR